LLAVGEREDRIARNEALFRDVNERVRALTGTFTSPSDREPVAFVCECGRADCAASIQLTIAEYEHVRSDSAQFVVASGHESPHVERVVQRREHYDIVRKNPKEAQIAIDTNPRT
jgi:hypothetical protein